MPLGRMHIDVVQCLRILPVFRRSLHHDVVLVEGRVHRRDLALAESIVESCVEKLGRDTETSGGLAVVHDIGLQSAVLLIAVDVCNMGMLRRRSEHARPIRHQILKIVARQRELILGSAGSPADAHILNGLKIDRSAGQLRQFWTEPRNDGLRTILL